MQYYYDALETSLVCSSLTLRSNSLLALVCSLAAPNLPSWRLPSSQSLLLVCPKRGPPRRSLPRWASSPQRRRRRVQRTILSSPPMTPLPQTRPQTTPQRARPKQVYRVQPALHRRMAQTLSTVLRPSACQTRKARQSRPEQRRHAHRVPPSSPNLPTSSINLPLVPHLLPSLRSRHLPPLISPSPKLSSPTPRPLAQAPQPVARLRRTPRQTAVRRIR
jgi:hypothetical protein